MERKLEKIKILLSIGFGAVVYLLAYLLVLGTLGSIEALQGIDNMYWNALAMCVGAGILALMIRKEEYGIRIRKKPVLQMLAVVLLAYGATVFFNFILGSIPWDKMFDAQVAPQETVFYSIPLWARMLCYVVVAPLAEELLFRQLIFQRLKKIAPLWLAVVISALLFGIYHGNLVQGIYAFTMGVFMALVYEWSGSLIAPVVFHMVANFVSNIAYEWQQLGNVMYSGIGIVCAFIVAVIAFVFLHKKQNKCSKKGLLSQ